MRLVMLKQGRSRVYLRGHRVREMGRAYSRVWQRGISTVLGLFWRLASTVSAKLNFQPAITRATPLAGGETHTGRLARHVPEG